MNRGKFVIVVAMFALTALPAAALHLKDLQLRDDKGAVRKDNKVPQGSHIFFTYDIDDLIVDPNTKKVNYQRTIELLDNSKKVLFKTTEWKEISPNTKSILDGFTIQIPPNQPPGAYSIKVSVTDTNAKGGRGIIYPIEVTK